MEREGAFLQSRSEALSIAKNTLLTGLLVTSVATCDMVRPTTSPQDAIERDHVLFTHHVRPEVIKLLRSVPFVNTHTGTRGGGMYRGLERGVEVNGSQEEAILHEESHAWFDIGIENKPEFCKGLEEELKEEADSTTGYYHELYYGDNKDFKGLKGNCTEQFASMSSFSMGNEFKVPEDIRNYYQTLYTWNDQK